MYIESIKYYKSIKIKIVRKCLNVAIFLSFCFDAIYKSSIFRQFINKIIKKYFYFAIDKALIKYYSINAKKQKASNLQGF